MFAFTWTQQSFQSSPVKYSALPTNRPFPLSTTPRKRPNKQRNILAGYLADLAGDIYRRLVQRPRQIHSIKCIVLDILYCELLELHVSDVHAFLALYAVVHGKSSAMLCHVPSHRFINHLLPFKQRPARKMGKAHTQWHGNLYCGWVLTVNLKEVKLPVKDMTWWNCRSYSAPSNDARMMLYRCQV